QLYMVTLHSPLGTVIWQFTTSTTKLPTRNDANSIQTQADSTYGKKMQQMQTTYPWLENLPLRTPDYFVAFDTSTNTFIADIYPTAGQYQNTQAAAIEDQIKKDLQKLGIDITKYTFSWTITPVSE
ncbi:MAG TPA: hypothetical protein VFQ63_00810, partial [Patescibacteria group bacterium]|nr:hypothetical protein [Patescibacteria group bacterium]